MADASALIDIIEHLEAPRHFFRPICDNLKQLADRLDSHLVHPIYDPATGGIKKVIFHVPQDNDGRLFCSENAEHLAESTSDDARVIPYLSDILQGHLQKLHAAKQELDVVLGKVPEELLGVLDAHCGRRWIPLVRQTVLDAILSPPRERWLSNDQPGWVPERVTDALEYSKRVDLETHWGEVEREIEQRTREVAAVRGRGKLPKPKPGPTVNDRMIAELACNLEEAKGWTAKKWADHLGCGQTTIKDTKTWKSLTLLRQQAKAEKREDRRRR